VPSSDSVPPQADDGIVSTAPVTAHVAVVELRRPPNNFFSVAMITAVADAFEALDSDDECRAIVLCADGKHFCAGADFSS
jgi:hypothetical protein